MGGRRAGSKRTAAIVGVALVALAGAVVVGTGAIDWPGDGSGVVLTAVDDEQGAGERRTPADRRAEAGWRGGWFEFEDKPASGPTPPTSEAQEEPPAEEPDPESAAEPTPSTTGGSDSPCGAFPSFPDETCTGWEHTGATLQECPTEITEPGATLDGCRFVGGLKISAANVTITRSLIEGLVQPRSDLQNLTLIDVEIDGTGRVDPSSPDGQLAIGSTNYTCIRCHIHGTGRGANLTHNVRIEDSYLHGFPYMNGKHMTAIGSNGGTGHVIRHNNLECNVSGCSAALSFYGDFAQVKDVLVEENLLNTTGSYCTYAGSVDSKEYPVGTNIRYMNNRFGKKFMPDCGRYGPVSSWSGGNGNVWQGNEWADGSGPVKL